jgi:hypothetical protein
MKRMLGVICALAALRAGADTLGDVRAAVNRLAARQPVRATFSTEASVKAAGRFSNENSARMATAEVTHDAAGISITVPQALIDKAVQESRTRTDGVNSARDAIGSLRSSAIIDAINYRDAFLTMLDNATVAEEKRVAFHGRPARQLVMKLNPRPKKESGSITVGSSKTDDRLTLWVADDNLPLAGERTQTTTAGFMFLKGTFASHSTYTFAHTADRLILARAESTDKGSGMGQNVEGVTVQTLTLH